MIELTPDAKRRFDDYLQRTRTALRGTRAVEADEVEQNVIEHVELALAGVPAPVGAESLGAVLAQLGPPERWLPDEELPIWRRTLGRLVNGPEDWRLAYLTFGVMALVFLAFPIGGVILLPVAFCLARACVELTQERGEPLGARAWLVLPPIWLAFLLFLGGALFLGIAAPAALASEQGMETLGFRDPANRAEWMRMYAGVILLSAGAWWIVLSGVFALLFTPIRSLFSPILAKMRRSQLGVLTGIGAAGAAIGVVLLWII